MLAGTFNFGDVCQPAWSSRITAARLVILLARSPRGAAHRGAVAPLQHEPGTDPALGTDRAKDVARSSALVARCGLSAAALGPATCDLVLLPDPCLFL